jgi:hypothetical protein
MIGPVKISFVLRPASLSTPPPPFGCVQVTGAQGDSTRSLYKRHAKLFELEFVAQIVAGGEQRGGRIRSAPKPGSTQLVSPANLRAEWMLIS